MSYRLAQDLLEQRGSFISDLAPGQFQPPAALRRALRTPAPPFSRLQGGRALCGCLGGCGVLVCSTAEENRVILSLFVSSCPSTVFLLEEILDAMCTPTDVQIC